MGSPWKALSDDNRRQIVLLLKNKDMIPTQIADELSFTLPAVSINLRILKESDLIIEKKQGKYRYYSLNRKTTSELAQFFDDMYDYNLKSLKEYVENKENKKRSRK
jgi:DNA-binding transcriptional ArsR family regulator